jgi:hypothetical protein
MPLKLNIAMSRKVGEANFGSRGATVGLEVETDTSLIDRPQQLYERIARLFQLAKESVDRELAPRATNKQIRAIHAIAKQYNLDLAAELHGRFAVERPDQLSLLEASQLIDAIRISTNGATDMA